MGALDLLIELARAGFHVVADSARITVRPASALTPDQRQQIVAHKPELLDIAPRRSWVVSVPGRDPFGISCAQGITRADVLARYPPGSTAHAEGMLRAPIERTSRIQDFIKERMDRPISRCCLAASEAESPELLGALEKGKKRE